MSEDSCIARKSDFVQVSRAFEFEIWDRRCHIIAAFRETGRPLVFFRICMFTTDHLSSLFDSALALVYPQACAVCGQSVESRADGVACSACWDATRVFAGEDTLCWKCGAFTAASIGVDRRKNVRCGQCDADSYSGARAVGFYEGALRVSILSLKREPHIARRVTQLMFA